MSGQPDQHRAGGDADPRPAGQRRSVWVADVPWLHMPSPDILTAEQRYGDPAWSCCHLLHAEPIAHCVTAVVWRPGRATPIREHMTWCVFWAIQPLGHPASCAFT